MMMNFKCDKRDKIRRTSFVRSIPAACVPAAPHHLGRPVAGLTAILPPILLTTALVLAGTPQQAAAQSLLTDQPPSVKLLFEHGIPLPPRRPSGFDPPKAAPPPQNADPAAAADPVTPAAPAAAPVATQKNDTNFADAPLPPVRPKDSASAPALSPIIITVPDKADAGHSGTGKGPATPDLPRDDIIKQASAALSEMTQFQADFTQIDAAGGKVTGHLAVIRPGRLRFDYNPPSSVLVVADGNSVGVIDRKLKTRDVYSLFLTPLKFLLKSKIDLGSDITILDVRSDADAYVITAEDKSTFAGTSKIALGFDKHTLKIKQWTVTDPQGYDTTVILGPLDTKSQPDGDLFVIPDKVG